MSKNGLKLNIFVNGKLVNQKQKVKNIIIPNDIDISEGCSTFTAYPKGSENIEIGNTIEGVATLGNVSFKITATITDIEAML